MNDTNIPVKDSIDLLEVDINKNLQFNSHVENICSKVNNQINVISRFRKIVPTDVKCKLYKAFIVPYFKYCSAVWHFCLFSASAASFSRLVWEEGEEGMQA